MIEFRPEEIFVRGIRNRRVQYYQPASERLNEGIEHFVFDNVLFDYSHIPAEQRFGDIEKTSERLFIWDKDKRRHWDCALGLYKGLLLPMTRIEELREEEEKQRQQAPLN
jgi:hypothetical protein